MTCTGIVVNCVSTAGLETGFACQQEKVKVYLKVIHADEFKELGRWSWGPRYLHHRREKGTKE
jgi:hypothetical protein